MRYIDSGTRDRTETLFAWLEQVMPDATYFGCQSGYFSYDGIFPFEQQFVKLLHRSGPVRLVLGANEAGVRRADLDDVLDLFDEAPGNTAASLVLVAADDVLMHPKTYYVERADGSKHALVGSVNLTNPGLSRNIEAAVVMDSTTDPSAPLDQIRHAIEKWHIRPHNNARLVTRATLAQLVADGVIDKPARPRPQQSPESRQNRARTFPALGAILRLPRKKRAVAPSTPVTRPANPTPVPSGTLGALPNGAVGIIKRLSKLDTKGFNGGTGTLYIALPNAVAGNLPMEPFGKNDEPRVDVSVEARLDTVPGEIVSSGSSPTNITHVGAGMSQTSNTDLRFNYLTAVKRGIEELAAAYSVAPPDEGDLVAIEFLSGVTVKVTFITEPGTVKALTPLLDRHAHSWGWLPTGVISPWESDEDDA